MSPGDVVGIGLNIARSVWNAMSLDSPFRSLCLLFAGAVVLWTFAEITFAIIEVIVESYLFASWSVLLMGFGGNAYTRDIAVGQLRIALSIGAKRFVLQCIVGLGYALMLRWATALPATVDYGTIAQMIVCPLIMWRLATRLPSRAQDWINGAHIGGAYVGQSGLANQGAAMTARAAAMTGEAIIGAGALGAGGLAAYDLARAQLEATNGGQRNSEGSALGRGARLAAMTAANMGAAAASDMGRRMAGDRDASHGYLGARMARLSSRAAETTRNQQTPKAP